MSWGKFTQLNQRFDDSITITTSNSFGLSNKFYQDHVQNKFKYAVLYYDPDRLAVGISFTNNEEEKHKFTIVGGKKSSGGQISARSFFNAKNLDAKKYHGKYTWTNEPNPEGGNQLYVIILKKQTQQSTNPVVTAGAPNVPPVSQGHPVTLSPAQQINSNPPQVQPVSTQPGNPPTPINPTQPLNTNDETNHTA
jgi:hypothetical protein